MFKRRTSVTPATFEATRPPPMPDIRGALTLVKSASEALEMAKRAWHRTDLEGALMLADYFLDHARRELDRTKNTVGAAPEQAGNQLRACATAGLPLES